MGDRAQVRMIDDGRQLFLYTHWRGTELPELVQKALRRKQRWDDPSYLARIIFCTMVEGNLNGETGFGIATFEAGDGKTITVDCDKQEVRWGDRMTTFTGYCDLQGVRW